MVLHEELSSFSSSFSLAIAIANTAKPDANANTAEPDTNTAKPDAAEPDADANADANADAKPRNVHEGIWEDMHRLW